MVQVSGQVFFRDPGSPSENGLKEPKYLSEVMKDTPNHHLTFGEPGSPGFFQGTVVF